MHNDEDVVQAGEVLNLPVASFVPAFPASPASPVGKFRLEVAGLFEEVPSRKAEQTPSFAGEMPGALANVATVPPDKDETAARSEDFERPEHCRSRCTARRLSLGTLVYYHNRVNSGWARVVEELQYEKDPTNSPVERQNILNNPYALAEIEKAAGIQGVPFEEDGCSERAGGHVFEVTLRTVENY